MGDDGDNIVGLRPKAAAFQPFRWRSGWGAPRGLRRLCLPVRVCAKRGCGDEFVPPAAERDLCLKHWRAAVRAGRDLPDEPA